MSPTHEVADVAALEALYGPAVQRSLDKEIDHLSAHYRAFVEASPFVALASAGIDGLDVSPRGDAAGFVTVEDPKTLLLPDRRGNNRIDTLRNVVSDPRVALLFLIPGIGETLRVNGRASISVEPSLLARFAVDAKPPRTVLVVKIERVYFQCSRAVVRADLWNPAKYVARAALPSTGAILEALANDGFDGRAYDNEMPSRVAASLY